MADLTWALATGAVYRMLCNDARPPMRSGGTSPVSRVDTRAHCAQRFDHTPHRSPRERGVAYQRRIETLTRQQSSQKTHARPCIAAVEWAHRRHEPVQTDAVNNALRSRRRFDTHAQLGEDRRRRTRVLAFKEAVDARRALGER